MKGFYLRFDFCDAGGTLWVDDVCLQEAIALEGWQSWPATGQDRHSLVADPLFVDAENDDYRFAPIPPPSSWGSRPSQWRRSAPTRTRCARRGRSSRRRARGKSRWRAISVPSISD